MQEIDSSLTIIFFGGIMSNLYYIFFKVLLNDIIFILNFNERLFILLCFIVEIIIF